MENKEKKEGGYIEIVFLLVVGICIAVLILVIGMDFYKTGKYSVGWVWQGRHGTAVMEFEKEEGGCVYFIDVWGSSVKTCGQYEIKKYND